MIRLTIRKEVSTKASFSISKFSFLLQRTSCHRREHRSCPHGIRTSAEKLAKSKYEAICILFVMISRISLWTSVDRLENFPIPNASFRRLLHHLFSWRQKSIFGRKKFNVIRKQISKIQIVGKNSYWLPKRCSHFSSFIKQHLVLEFSFDLCVSTQRVEKLRTVLQWIKTPGNTQMRCTLHIRKCWDERERPVPGITKR